jgi:pimeloyl-ACP methyl ester carboxylesterase
MKQSTKKELYKVTWENIAPPYKDYEYFMHCENYPFPHNAVTFNLVNAWWLIEAATLVYAEEDFVRDRFLKANLKEVRYFSGEKTQCFVARNADFIIVAFRGTELRQCEGCSDFRNVVADIKADVDIRLVDSGRKGKVHKGFNDGLDEVWKELYSYLKGIHREGRTVWMTGHSLGAALATLAAYRYGRVQGLYTFGSPRVGDKEFKKDFKVRAYRIENNNDIVCKVPPPGLYCHVGELRYIDSNGSIHPDLIRWKRWIDEIKGHLKNALYSFRLGVGLRGLVPDAIKDHVPVLYAIHIWNNLLKNEA